MYCYYNASVVSLTCTFHNAIQQDETTTLKGFNINNPGCNPGRNKQNIQPLQG
jgi:hypothetical protein